MKWRGHESVRRGLRDSKITPEFIASGHSNVSITTPSFKKEKRFTDTNSVIHPSSRSNVGEVKPSRSNNAPAIMGDYLASASQKENIVSREPTTVTKLIQQLINSSFFPTLDNGL